MHAFSVYFQSAIPLNVSYTQANCIVGNCAVSIVVYYYCYTFETLLFFSMIGGDNPRSITYHMNYWIKIGPVMDLSHVGTQSILSGRVQKRPRPLYGLVVDLHYMECTGRIIFCIRCATPLLCQGNIISYSSQGTGTSETIRIVAPNINPVVMCFPQQLVWLANSHLLTVVARPRWDSESTTQRKTLF